MKRALLLMGLLFCSVNGFAQTLSEDLAAINWPDGWTYQLQYDQDSLFHSRYPFKKYFKSEISFSYNNKNRGWFFVGECNEKNGFCDTQVEFINDSIQQTTFGQVISIYLMSSNCIYRWEHPPISSFRWKSYFFLAPLCSCIPNQNESCLFYESFLKEVFGYVSIPAQSLEIFR